MSPEVCTVFISINKFIITKNRWKSFELVDLAKFKTKNMKKLTLFAISLVLITFSSCEKEEDNILGCMNSEALNYNASANQDDGSCVILGCTDASAMNFNSIATNDDNSCEYYGNLFAGNFNVTETCNSADYNYTQEITSEGNTITLINAFGWSVGNNNNVSITVSGESFSGTFEGLEIENQNGEIDPCAYEIDGQINSNNITMTYTIYIDGEEFDSCTATLTLSTGGINTPNNPKSLY